MIRRHIIDNKVSGIIVNNCDGTFVNDHRSDRD